MTTFPVVLQEWLESECGWGQRPDGYSVHLSVGDSKKYVEEYWAREKASNISGGVPDCYSRPCGNPIVKDVDKNVYDKLKQLKKEGKSGFRIWKLNEVETKAEKKARERAEKKRLNKIKADKEKREQLKKSALSKLTKEEKAVLGLDEKPKSTRDPNRGWRSY